MGTKTAVRQQERGRGRGEHREKKVGRAVVRWTTQQQQQHSDKEEEKQKVEMKCTLT